MHWQPLVSIYRKIYADSLQGMADFSLGPDPFFTLFFFSFSIVFDGTQSLYSL